MIENFEKPQLIIVSSCLAGINCRFDGERKPCEKIVELVRLGIAIPMCPEQLGGLSTPRNPAEIVGNKVITINGDDVTNEFEKGAQEVLRIAKLIGCRKAILKAKSPSCGGGKIYDGSFTGKLIDGDGITVRLLKENGIEVLSEEEILNLN